MVENESINVKIAAASYLLVHDEQLAVSVLDSIACEEIPHKSFSAKMVLSERRKGDLKL